MVLSVIPDTGRLWECAEKKLKLRLEERKEDGLRIGVVSWIYSDDGSEGRVKLRKENPWIGRFGFVRESDAAPVNGGG